MKWEVYYADETSITSDERTWQELPAYGVLIIIEYLPDNKRLIHMGMNYYILRDDTIISCNDIDIKDQMLQGLSPNSVKFGRWVSNCVWQRVHKRVFG